MHIWPIHPPDLIDLPAEDAVLFLQDDVFEAQLAVPYLYSKEHKRRILAQETCRKWRDRYHRWLQ